MELSHTQKGEYHQQKEGEIFEPMMMFSPALDLQ